MDRRSSSAALTRGVSYVAAACCAGLLCAFPVWAAGAGTPTRATNNIFWFLFVRYEPSALALLLTFCLLLRMTVLREVGSHYLDRAASLLQLRRLPLVAAGFTLFVSLVGWCTAYHAHPFSMDEYGAVFQAQIFAAGQLVAEVPQRWTALALPMTPIFVNYDPTQHTWISAYLPVYALLRAPFEALGIGGLCNPLLAAASVLLIAAIGRVLWPSWRCAGPVAALLLVTSTQFLVTSMSAYSMPAHLAFNLFWLWLYMRASRASWLLMPWWGALAMGLHQFVPHVLFAAPLLLRVVLQRRWLWGAYFGIVYLGSVAAWWLWRVRISDAGLTPAVSAFFGLPGPLQLFRTFPQIALVFSWQSIGLGILFVVGLTVRMQTQHGSVLSDLKAGVLLTMVSYLFVMPDQGHGWGYRYLYPVLGNVVIIATLGAQWLDQELQDARALRLAVSGAVLALCVQLPLRLYEIDAVIAPFARASANIASRATQSVVVPVDAAWYAQDLIRNDPLFRDGPVVLATVVRTAPRQRNPNDPKQQVVRPEELLSFGMFGTPPVSP